MQGCRKYQSSDACGTFEPESFSVPKLTGHFLVLSEKLQKYQFESTWYFWSSITISSYKIRTYEAF